MESTVNGTDVVLRRYKVRKEGGKMRLISDMSEKSNIREGGIL